MLRLITAIQLTRLSLAFGAVSDLWFVILLSRALGPESAAATGFAANGAAAPLAPPSTELPVHTLPLAVALGAGAIVAIGLFAFGASLNDLLDARHDTAFSPERPIPAGRIRAGQAVIVTVGALLAALVGAITFGDGGLLLAALAAAGILFYNAAGKHVPAVGLITIGLVHAAHMAIPNDRLAFTLPIWLVVSHAIAVAIGVYILEGKRPSLSPRSMVAVAIGYLFWSTIILGAGVARAGVHGLWPAEVPIIGLVWPLLAVVSFAVVARRKTEGVTGRVGAEKLRRYGAMWQCLYGAAWLLALDLREQATWMGLLALVGFATMTMIKEANGLTGRPLEFRG